MKKGTILAVLTGAGIVLAGAGAGYLAGWGGGEEETRASEAEAAVNDWGEASFGRGAKAMNLAVDPGLPGGIYPAVADVWVPGSGTVRFAVRIRGGEVVDATEMPGG